MFAAKGHADSNTSKTLLKDKALRFAQRPEPLLCCEPNINRPLLNPKLVTNKLYSLMVTIFKPFLNQGLEIYSITVAAFCFDLNINIMLLDASAWKTSTVQPTKWVRSTSVAACSCIPGFLIKVSRSFIISYLTQVHPSKGYFPFFPSLISHQHRQKYLNAQAGGPVDTLELNTRNHV